MLMQLIINADDYGMTQAINESIIDLISHKRISSTSVMINMPFAEQVQSLIKFSDISIGLHINFTQGKPVSKTSNVFSLVDKNGNFLEKSILLNKISNNQVRYEHVKAELYAQYEKLQHIVGDKLIHFDSHQGSSRIPMVYQALIELTKEKNLNLAIRVHSKYYLSGSSDKPKVCEPNILNVHKFGIKRVLAEYYFRKKRDNWRKIFRTPDGMLFNSDNNAISTLSELTKIKTKININGIYEISCHPASNSTDLTETVMKDVRIDEYNLLKSEAFEDTTKYFNLVSYNSLFL